jgi:carboxypeptidase D
VGINLKGAAIGNGWIDARRQYPSYIDFVTRVGVFEEKSDVSLSVLENMLGC